MNNKFKSTFHLALFHVKDLIIRVSPLKYNSRTKQWIKKSIRSWRGECLYQGHETNIIINHTVAGAHDTESICVQYCGWL